MLQSKLNYYGEVVNRWVEPAKAEPIRKTFKESEKES
jgi:hypothetical protein